MSELSAEQSSRSGGLSDITVKVTRLGDFDISPAKVCSRQRKHLSVNVQKR